MAGASYLLKAPESDLTRWRERAGNAGVSFASFVRAALDAYDPAAAGRDNGMAARRAAEEVPHERAASTPARRRAARPATADPIPPPSSPPPPILTGGDLSRSFRPDPKPERKR